MISAIVDFLNFSPNASRFKCGESGTAAMKYGEGDEARKEDVDEGSRVTESGNSYSVIMTLALREDGDERWTQDDEGATSKMTVWSSRLNRLLPLREHPQVVQNAQLI